MVDDQPPKGLADVVVSQTKITSINGELGKLFHCGYEISDLAANSTFEELTYLLFYGNLPNQSEFSEHR